MAKVLDLNATIEKREDFSEELAIFRVRPDDPLPDGDWFVPGQYMVIGVNNVDEPELGGVQRPMSIASEPAERGHVEFYIRRVGSPESKNPLTHSLFKLQQGDRVFCAPSRKGTSRFPEQWVRTTSAGAF